VRILWLGTKCPWPPADGGRLLSFDTIRLLSRRHKITLVVPEAGGAPSRPSREAEGALAPFCQLERVPVRERPPLLSVAATVAGLRPFTIDRHRHAAVDARVEQLLRQREFDLVHAEQLHALPPPKSPCWRLPVILREQNVECDLWYGAARYGNGPLAWGMGREARRLERWEAAAVRRSALTVTLTAEDRVRLLAVSGAPEAKVVAVPVPFTPSAEAGGVPLPGRPAVVLVGSAGWRPNSDGARWFVESVWPEVARRLPGAVLHLFGEAGTADAGPSLHLHGAPPDISAALATGAICVVPLRFASGIRMRILDAWSRGVPVVATPVAAAGTEGEDGTHLLLAENVEGFARAFRRLQDEPSLASDLAANGRALLRRRHAPEEAVARLEAAYALIAG
jgi:glycosyltransferase involved in cell wall biosynthesis